MRLVLTSCIVLLVGVPGVAVQAQEPLALYDDFNAPLINPAKWRGRESGTVGVEAVREIRGNRLRMVNRAYGGTTSDSGAQTDNRLRMQFADSSGITAIAATVRVTHFEATGCPANPGTPTQIQARLSGFFFSALNPLAIPFPAVRDVLAAILVERRSDSPDPPEVLRVRSFVFHCGDLDCFSGTTLGADDLGPINRGEKASLRIQWDPGNDRFIFQRDAEPEVFSPYTLSPTAPGPSLVKRLDVVPSVANCKPPQAQTIASMEVFFDDVFVNASAVF